MKTIPISASLVLFAFSTLAQGTVEFTLSAPIYGPEKDNPFLSLTGNSANYTGNLVSGSGYFAQVYHPMEPGSEFPSDGYPLATFGTGSQAGYVDPTIVTISGIPMDAPSAVLQLRVWDNTSGRYPTYGLAQDAIRDGLIAAGWSKPITVYDIGGLVNSAPPLTAFESFNLFYQVPEPSIPALAALAAAFFSTFRRARGIAKKCGDWPEAFFGRNRLVPKSCALELPLRISEPGLCSGVKTRIFTR